MATIRDKHASGATAPTPPPCSPCSLIINLFPKINFCCCCLSRTGSRNNIQSIPGFPRQNLSQATDPPRSGCLRSPLHASEANATGVYLLPPSCTNLHHVLIDLLGVPVDQIDLFGVAVLHNLLLIGVVLVLVRHGGAAGAGRGHRR